MQNEVLDDVLSFAKWISFIHWIIPTFPPFPLIMSLPKSLYIGMDYYFASRNQGKSFLKMLSFSNLFNWVLLLYRGLWARNYQWVHTQELFCVFLSPVKCAGVIAERHTRRAGPTELYHRQGGCFPLGSLLLLWGSYAKKQFSAMAQK